MIEKLIPRIRLALFHLYFVLIFQKKKRRLKDDQILIRNMRHLHMRLIQAGYLDSENRLGDQLSKSQRVKQLALIFSNEQGNEMTKEDFYIEVSRKWSRTFNSTAEKISLLTFIGFLLLWLFPLIIGIQSISGVFMLLYITILIGCPSIGLFFALLITGWKRWLLTLAHLFSMSVIILSLL
ncbi:hypothetical protein [Bacillus sp. AK128]